MPTVLRIAGYEIVLYMNDPLPHHVDVFAHGCVATIQLSYPDGTARVRENRNFKSQELKKVVRIVQAVALGCLSAKRQTDVYRETVIPKVLALAAESTAVVPIHS